MKKYKLTNAEGKTRNDTQWGLGISHCGTGKGPLCGPGWIHVYDSPLLAVLLNSLHVAFQDPRCWECEVSGKHLDDHGLKSGWEVCTTMAEVALPVATVEQAVVFGILCAREVYRGAQFVEWSDNWLSGRERSALAASASASAAWAAKSIDLQRLAERAMEYGGAEGKVTQG